MPHVILCFCTRGRDLLQTFFRLLDCSIEVLHLQTFLDVAKNQFVSGKTITELSGW